MDSSKRFDNWFEDAPGEEYSYEDTDFAAFIHLIGEHADTWAVYVHWKGKSYFNLGNYPNLKQAMNAASNVMLAISENKGV